MSFVGWNIGKFIAISALAINVYTAVKYVPDHDRNILEEIAVLRILIDKSAKHFKGTTISSADRHDGQKILQRCQSILEDIGSLIEKYKRLTRYNKRVVLTGVKTGKGNIITLPGRLTTDIVSLNGFVRRFVVPDILFTSPIILMLIFLS